MSNDQYQPLPTTPLANILKDNKGKILIFGNFGAFNLGDEAILSGELQLIKQVSTDGSFNTIVVSRYPREVKRLHHTKAVFLLNPFLILYHVITSRMVIIGGGGLFCRNDNGAWGIFFQLYTLGFYGLSLLFGKKVYGLGLGVYTNPNPLISYLTMLILRNATFISVRDPASLSNLNLNHIQAKFYKDLSFSLPIQKSDIPKPVRDFFDRSKHLLHVGIALTQPERKEESKSLTRIIRKFVQKHYKTTAFLFYTLDSHPYYPNDYKYIESILRPLEPAYQTKASVLIVPASLAPQAVFASFMPLDFIVAMRLHAQIFAYRFNVPFLGIAYAEKGKSFLQAINKPVIKVSDLSYRLLDYSFEQAVNAAAFNHRPLLTKNRPFTKIAKSIRLIHHLEYLSQQGFTIPHYEN